MSGICDETLLPNFSMLCRETLGREMNTLREEAARINLSRQATCVAIIVAAIHVQALALVGGDLSPDDFEDLLESDIKIIRDKLAAKGSVWQ